MDASHGGGLLPGAHRRRRRPVGASHRRDRRRQGVLPRHGRRSVGGHRSRRRVLPAGRIRQTIPLSIPKPIVAAINGACAGIGLIQALMCDVRFCANNAKLTTAFSRRGLPAENAVAWLLTRLVGQGVAADLLLSARVLTAAEAHSLGLVNVVVDADVLPAAVAYARDLAENCSAPSYGRHQATAVRIARSAPRGRSTASRSGCSRHHAPYRTSPRAFAATSSDGHRTSKRSRWPSPRMSSETDHPRRRLRLRVDRPQSPRRHVGPCHHRRRRRPLPGSRLPRHVPRPGVELGDRHRPRTRSPRHRARPARQPDPALRRGT